MRARLDTLVAALGLGRARRAGRRASTTTASSATRGAWVSLPPVEARLTRLLLDRFGAVVSREALAKAGWPDGAPGRNALDVHVLRLRRRLAEVGLAIRTVRSRGYLLEASQRTHLAGEASQPA